MEALNSYTQLVTLRPIKLWAKHDILSNKASLIRSGSLLIVLCSGLRTMHRLSLLMFRGFPRCSRDSLCCWVVSAWIEEFVEGYYRIVLWVGGGVYVMHMRCNKSHPFCTIVSGDYNFGLHLIESSSFGSFVLCYWCYNLL